MESKMNVQGVADEASAGPFASTLRSGREDATSATVPNAPAHSPLPWFATAKNSIKTDLRRYGLREDAGIYIASVMGGPTSGPRFPDTLGEVEANAEFIIHACNNHYKLRDTLSDLRTAWFNGRMDVLGNILTGDALAELMDKAEGKTL